MTDDDDDDDEPFFHVHYIKDNTIEYNDGYWEQYDRLDKSWTRLCDECIDKVCQPSQCLCEFHYNEKKMVILKPCNMKKRMKRLNKKVKRKVKKKVSSSTPIMTTEIEPIVKDENESSGMFISISSSLSRKQTAQVKSFITKFDHPSKTIQWTCESQVDYIDDTTTHLIASDTGLFSTNVTKQIVQACVRHVFISSIDWIIASLDQSFVLDYFPFEILRDKRSLKDSRGIKQCRFNHLPVFPSSYVLSAECRLGIKHLKMTHEELLEIIDLSGATLFNQCIPYKTLIILCNSKKEMEIRKKENDDDKMNVIYYCKPEFLFDSIVRHEVQAIENYAW